MNNLEQILNKLPERIRIPIQELPEPLLAGLEEIRPVSYTHLRSGAGNLTIPQMEEGIAYAHARNVRCYLTLNIFAHNEDILPLEDYLIKIKALDIDAFIVSDPGIMLMIREVMPQAEIHLSTQANMTNYKTARFWQQQGVKRIVLARELTFEESRLLRQKLPEEMELEAFVQGAMCISYSGRCLLSNFMIEMCIRDSWKSWLWKMKKYRN